MASEVVCDLGLSHVPYHPVFTNLGYPRPKHFGSTYNLNPQFPLFQNDHAKLEQPPPISNVVLVERKGIH